MSILFEEFGPVIYALLLPFIAIWFLASLTRKGNIQKPHLFASDGLFNAKLGAGQAFIIVVLVVSLLAICERILFDLSRNMVGGGFNYANSLETIFVHAVFIVPVLAFSIILNVIIGQKRKKYAVVLMPYFVTTAILAIQLVGGISVYFSKHHTTFQLYVVLLALIAMTSYSIWFIQRLYNQRLEEMKESLQSSSGS